MSSCSFKNVINKIGLQIMYSVYMYKQDLALNNLQSSIINITKPTKSKCC